jgi:spore coat-associated protein N
MEAPRLSRLLSLAAIVAISGCAAASSGVRTEPHAVISQASGELYVTNSRDGQAVFQAQGLAPGRSVTGTVQLSNAGSLAGDLGFEQLDVQDQPGVNGGRLSDAVHLDVEDVTGGNQVPVYAGQLGSLQSRALGNIAPSEARTYRFTASLPDGGAPPSPTAGDNAYSGSALTVRYSWTATAPEPTDGGGGGTDGGGTGDGTGGAGPVEPTFRFYVVSKQVLKRGVLDVMATCDRACNVSAYAQLPKVKGARATVKTRAMTATLPAAGKVARIRLKLSKKSKGQLIKALRRQRKVALSVKATVRAASGGPSRAYTKKVVVKRPKRR